MPLRSRIGFGTGLVAIVCGFFWLTGPGVFLWPTVVFGVASAALWGSSRGERAETPSLSDEELEKETARYTVEHPIVAFVVAPLAFAALVFGIGLWKYTVDAELAQAAIDSLPWAAFAFAMAVAGAAWYRAEASRTTEVDDHE